MNGAEILRQVREALAEEIAEAPHVTEGYRNLLAALDGGVLLTREEAGAAHQTFTEVVSNVWPDGDVPVVVAAALALLSDEAGDD